MPVTRLNQYRRSRLSRLARELVEATKEKKALAKAYSVAAPLIRAVVEKALPPADMRVLRKYDKAEVLDKILLNLPAGGVKEFSFEKEAGPLAIRHRVFNADDATMRAFNAWDAALSAHKKARDTKIADYDSLIAQAPSFESLVAVWPEAERLRPEFATNLPLAFSPEVVARIRADVKARLKEAA